MSESLISMGWKEWACLPQLNIKQIKAKIDTGARTSTLHAFRIDIFQDHGQYKVNFDVHPLRGITHRVVTCQADLADKRWVSDSGGHREHRCIITTLLHIGLHQWPIEISLTNRDDMRFRMLLGRSALRGRAIVNPGVAYQLGKPQ